MAFFFASVPEAMSMIDTTNQKQQLGAASISPIPANINKKIIDVMAPSQPNAVRFSPRAKISPHRSLPQ
jgi:hypothetical protein